MSETKKKSMIDIGDEMLQPVAIPKKINKPRVLLVDDDPVFLAVLEPMIRSFGVEVVIRAGDGNEAWNLIRKSLREHRPYDLIISDWNMPTSDGLKLLVRIRSHVDTHNIPVILITGRHRREDIEEAIHLKVSDYIAKPVKPAVLREKLEKILGALGETTRAQNADAS